MKHKLLFLYLRTGSGHLAPARSIVNYITKKHPQNIEPQLIDGFAGVNRVVKNIVEGGYRNSQAKAVWVYEVLYAINKLEPFAKITALVLSYFVRPHLEKLILIEKPRKILVFHSFLIKPVNDIVRLYDLQTTVYTVVTDPFSAPPLWFIHKGGKYIVFSEKLKNYCITKKKIPQEDIFVFPFILEEKFSQPLSSDIAISIKKRLGFPADKKIILILGGGDGMPKGESIIKSFIQTNASIAIVCGNNKELYRNASRIKMRYNLTNLFIYGYVDFIYELMNISDVVVTKCGANTIMEILISGKIPLINKYIWEQERGNMEFVRDNMLGIYENDIGKLPAQTMNILGNESTYNFYKNNIKNAQIKNGTPEVAEFLVST